MQDLRARYWQSLPTKAYRLRRLIRKGRAGELQPGEREELELLGKRLAESGASYGFEEVSRIGDALSDLLDGGRRTGELDFEELENLCDELDRFIDDMTVDALATGLSAFWR